MSAGFLTTVRMSLRYGLPLLGVFVIGRAVVLSIGGDISKAQFALGILLLAAGFSARLVPKPASAKRMPAKRARAKGSS